MRDTPVGTGQELGHGRTACLTKSDWKGCICPLRACHGAGGGVGRGRCLGDPAAQREGCED